MINNVLLIVNTGTPDDPGVKSVRKYLSEFLNDPKVIDMPLLIRKILVNLIIVPFRAPRSARLYKKLWTAEGSPLKVNHMNLVEKLQIKLKGDYTVIGAMRYGNPSLDKVLEEIKQNSVKNLTILPLFPQYASSTTGSIHELIRNKTRSWNKDTSIHFIEQFYSHPAFIGAFADRIRKYKPETFDHLLFSYHSLPVRHIQNEHPGIDYNNCTCKEGLPHHGSRCYRATCYETTRLISQKLNLKDDLFSTSFQSRFSRNWVAPFTDQVLSELAANGKKRILVAAPSFVADCLETIVEIGDGYSGLFRQAGGEELVMVESLNDSDEWVDAVIQIAY